MYDNEIQTLIENTIKQIIEKSNDKISFLQKKHDKKIHFIPKKYRIISGLLQSMNIQFGNFIENLLKNLIKREDKYELITKYENKTNNTFRILEKNDQLIDEYITRCQTETFKLQNEFENLKKSLFKNIKLNKNNKNFLPIKHDIDLLFKNKDTNKIYYVEIKYNDDHDTGKFIDINRKFIKTYSYLLNEFDIENENDIVPILFFFNNLKMKGNIYIPEETNIKRGKTFFDEFLDIKYEKIDNYLSNLSENPRTIEIFDELYKKIRFEKIKD